MKEIRSESRFLLKFIFRIILTPITIIQILLKRKKPSAVLTPVKDLINFILEPRFTITVIALNILMFFISFTLFSEDFFMSLISYPSDLLSLRLYTLITSGFLHANIGHLTGNMIALFIFGRVVEKHFGSLKTMFIYFSSLIISGLFSSLIYLAQGTNIGGLGASGALMGLIATAILIKPYYITYELLIPMPIFLVGWFAIYADIIGILNPVQDGIGHFAHIGGFLSITIIMYFLNEKDKAVIKKGLLINIISGILLALLFLLFNRIM